MILGSGISPESLIVICRWSHEFCGALGIHFNAFHLPSFHEVGAWAVGIPVGPIERIVVVADKLHLGAANADDVSAFELSFGNSLSVYKGAARTTRIHDGGFRIANDD